MAKLHVSSSLLPFKAALTFEHREAQTVDQKEWRKLKVQTGEKEASPSRVGLGMAMWGEVVEVGLSVGH